MPSTTRRPALILRILVVLAALVGLGAFVFYAGISVLFFSYFKTLNVLCVLAGVIGGFLCVLAWATGRRTLASSYLVTAGPPEGDVARLAAFLRSPEGRSMVEDVGYVAP